MNLKNILGLCLFICLGLGLRSQHKELLFENLSTSSGLPSPIIYDLHYAKDGVLYLGTGAGLVAYNGMEFKSIAAKSTRGLSVHAIQEDHKGGLWCLNFNNQVLKLRGDSLEVFEAIQGFLDQYGTLKDYLLQKEGLYLLTEQALLWCDFKGRGSEILRVMSNSEQNTWVSIRATEQPGVVLLADLHHIYEYHQSGELRTIRDLPSEERVVEQVGGQIASAPKNGFNDFFLDTDSFSLINAPKNNYLNRLIQIDSSLWFCTNTGLYQWLINQQSFEDPIFQDRRVTDIVKDRWGAYWIATLDRGLFHLPNLNTYHLRPSEYALHRLEIGPNGTIFAGSGDGRLYQLNSDGKLLAEWASPFRSEIEFLYYDSINSRMISSHGILNFKDQSFRALRLGKDIFPDGDGNFGIITHNQAVLINQDFSSAPQIPQLNKAKTGQEWPKYSSAEIPYYPLFSKRSRAGIYSAKDRAYYLGASDGFYKVVPGNTQKQMKYKEQSLFVNHIHRVDERSSLLSTSGHGILWLKNDSIIPFSINQGGMSKKVVYKTIGLDGSLLILDQSGLWSKDKHRNLPVAIGEQRNLSNVLIYDMISHGELIYLATDRGLIFFPLQQELAPKQARITEISLWSNGEKISRLSLTKALSQRDLSIKASVISLARGEDFSFHYRLVGYDSTWQQQSSLNPNFSYLALPPGKYRFELATNNRGSLGPLNILNFEIKARFTESFGFYLILSCCIFLLSYLVFRWLLKEQKKKQLIHQGLIESQLSSLRAQMNPHFLFNVLNSVQGMIYSNQRNEASDLLGKLSSLMRRVLEQSSEPNISIRDELLMITNYLELEKTRFEEDFSYQLKVDLEPEDQEIEIPSMIIQPFIENAIKHGLLHKKGSKKLGILLGFTAERNLEIVVEDNGIGREAATQIKAKRGSHRSYANEAIEKRIFLINKARKNHRVSLKIKDLKSSSNIPTGTRVTLKIEFL